MKSRERFLNACRCETVDRPPVWLMRQAGRYLPEYQAIRAKHNFITMATTPDLITEISLQPWRRFQMDAVIVFSDILIPPRAMGLDLQFVEGEGPQFTNPIRRPEDIKALQSLDPQTQVPFLLDSLRSLRTTLKDEAALLGFAGSPWTTLSYMIDGEIRDWIDKNPDSLRQLLDTMTTAIGRYVEAQIDAGVDAIQFFDTWGGVLSPDLYAEWSAPYLKKLVAKVRAKKTPAILFVKNSAPLLQRMVGTGADVISISEETSLKTARQIVGPQRAIQGNIDPNLLLSQTPAQVSDTCRGVLDQIAHQPGHIINLGHGVLPKTPVDNVASLVNTVRAYAR